MRRPFLRLCPAGFCKPFVSLFTILSLMLAAHGFTAAAVAASSTTNSLMQAQYNGYLDVADCDRIAGWAWDQSQPDAAINVDIYDGNTLLATVPANLFRGDLLDAGIGNGYHAFDYAVPSNLRDGQQHTINVRYAGTASDLQQAPQVLTCAGNSPSNAALFVSQDVPATMTAGQSANVSVTVKNTGTATWTSGALYRLGSQNPQDNGTWGLGRAMLAAAVAPGANATFNFTVTAPATPGTYNFQWRMVQDAVEWFGDYTPNISVNVTSSSSASQADAVRFLEQSTFGPNEALVARVQSIGFEAYLNEQFAAPISGYQDFPYYPPTAPADCVYQGANPTGPSSICNRDNYSLFQLQLRFFQNAMTAQDQLRQRVAFALSQILVVSGNEISQPYAMGPYQQILNRGAFGNFRQMLYDITLSPAMGRYLDMVNNDKPNPATGVEPNENYARELLQLFSIGTNKLNQDGTLQLDAQGKPIPAYDQETVEGFAHVFTGWTYPTKPGATLQKRNPDYYIGPMVVYPSNHDTGQKQLLNGTVLPAGQTANKDLNDAIDNVFNHPNVAPFISKQLIQHLVTSNPSPAYVARVSAVFNNNGQGVRGDLKAVVKVILLDEEARGDVRPEVEYGHLHEPVLFAMNVLRALNGTTDGVYLRGQVSAMGQNLFYSPSVFNYYPPDYVVPGTNILGPEFAIQNTATTLNRANFINSVVFSNGIGPDATVPGATGTRVDLSSLQPLAGNPQQLLDRLNVLMMHGTMSAGMRNSIAQAVSTVAATDTLGRVRAAVYLIATSSQYQVKR